MSRRAEARTRSDSRRHKEDGRENRVLGQSPWSRPSESEDATLSVHDRLDHGGRSHHAAAFRDKIAFVLVKKFEICRARPEARALVMRFLDPIVDCFRITRFHVQLVGYAFEK